MAEAESKLSVHQRRLSEIEAKVDSEDPLFPELYGNFENIVISDFTLYFDIFFYFSATEFGSLNIGMISLYFIWVGGQLLEVKMQVGFPFVAMKATYLL